MVTIYMAISTITLSATFALLILLSTNSELQSDLLIPIICAFMIGITACLLALVEARKNERKSDSKFESLIAEIKRIREEQKGK